MSSSAYGIFNGFLSFAEVGILVAFLVVVLTTVRTRRPDAWQTLAFGVGVLLFNLVLSTFGAMLATMLIEQSGIGMELSRFFVFQSATTMLLDVAGWVLFVAGAVKLAAPPPQTPPTFYPMGPR